MDSEHNLMAEFSQTLILLPTTRFPIGEECKGSTSINSHSTFFYLHEVKKKLSESLFNKLKNTFLGPIIKSGLRRGGGEKKGDGLGFSARLVHFLIARQIITTRKNELWFYFNNQPMRFTLREFHLITELPYKAEDEDEDEVEIQSLLVAKIQSLEGSEQVVRKIVIYRNLFTNTVPHFINLKLWSRRHSNQHVLYGNDLDTTTFSSGFPLSGPSESCNYKTSGWNLNNTAKLPGSLLSFEDCESIGVPRLSVGMCLSSQFWKSEKERLYSLCYLHIGAPRVWYSVAGCHRSKVMSLFPEMPGEQQSKMSRDPVMIMSPYALSLEGIPVTRCVQNPGQYVVLFPGSCYSAVNCGFNSLEKANFAPVDWLPHGDVAALQNQEKRGKSLISYDKLLLGAAREAVNFLKEYSLSRKKTADIMRWYNASSREGIFSNMVKSRVKQEKIRREFLGCSLKSQRIDDDDVSKRECCVCFVDLHLSAVQCSCSADRYSCLSHMRNLCDCLRDKKSFLYRYTIDELNILVEALEKHKLSSMLKWGDIVRSYCTSPAIKRSSQPEDKGQITDDEDAEAGTKEQMKPRVKAISIMEIMNNTKEANDDESGPMKPCTNKSAKPCDSSAVNSAKKQKQG